MVLLTTVMEGSNGGRAELLSLIETLPAHQVRELLAHVRRMLRENAAGLPGEKIAL